MLVHGYDHLEEQALVIIRFFQQFLSCYRGVEGQMKLNMLFQVKAHVREYFEIFHI